MTLRTSSVMLWAMRIPNFLMLSAALVLGTTAAHATTKGLNQIPTPDVQPQGILSLSFQQVQPQIDNASQLQLEYGINKRFEVAAVQGISPGETRLGAEFGIIQRKPIYLSVGFLNYSTTGASPESFVEGGYYTGKEQFMAGVARVSDHNQALLGYQHVFSKWLMFSSDYQSGPQSFSTVGVTFTHHNLVVNPALYITNNSPRHQYGYIVFTYNLDINARQQAASETPAPHPSPKQ